MLLICLLLLVGVARAQQPIVSTSGAGPSGTNTLPDTNPWHELLQKMMSLMQSAGAVTPSIKSHGIEPSPVSNQNQGQRKYQGQGQFSEPNSNRPGQMQGQLTEPPYNEPAITPDQYQTPGQQVDPYTDTTGQGMDRLNQGTWQQTNRLQDQTSQTGQNQTQGSSMKTVNEQAGPDVQNQGMPQERELHINQSGNHLQGQRQELEPPRQNREQSNIPMPPQPQQRVQTTSMAPPVTQPPIQDCFWEGRFYSPGGDIVRGQHDRWCYVTYCDSQGQIQFWDDYNCPPNSMRPTSEHNSGRQEANIGSPPQPGGAVPGCNYKGIFYEPGQEISNHNIGERCYGEYCNQYSKVVKWEDWCTTRTTVDPLIGAGPNPANQRDPVSPQPPSHSAGPKRNSQSTGQTGRVQAKKPAGGSPGQDQASGMQSPGPTVGSQGQGGLQDSGLVGGPARQGQTSGMHGQGPMGGSQGQGQSSRPQVQSQGAPGGGRARGPKQGCYHNNLQYQPNEDVIVGSIGDLCYGYYCEGDNVFVHWEDKCSPIPMNPIVPTAPPATGTGFYFK